MDKISTGTNEMHRKDMVRKVMWWEPGGRQTSKAV